MRLGRAFVAMAILLGGVCSSLLAVPDFSFVHLSDVHVPYALDTSRQTIAALPIGPIPLEPYGITAAAPAFAFVTGDLTEFGGGDGNWEKYLSLWTGLPYRVHHLAGNHDNTWDAIRPRLERLEGGDCYAFEQFGCKFIAPGPPPVHRYRGAELARDRVRPHSARTARLPFLPSSAGRE